ncbi:MAG: YihY/virulence factor BrkB family protein [Acidobacteria bacterium]|nr:YihY/virulence factor BrkB family protein [Acidobacteriota bacterium]
MFHDNESGHSGVPASSKAFVDRRRLRYYYRLAASTVQYLTHTEVHTFAFSVAANAILSFFPFVLLLMTLSQRVFRSATMSRVINDLLGDNLPAGREFVIRNLSAMAAARSKPQFASLLILLITSTGVFLPLEVALNRVWRFPSNRSYLGNQLIALALAFASGILALLSIALSAGNLFLLRMLALGHDLVLFRILAFVTDKVFATLASMAVFFLIYWLLPNGKVPARAVLPAAIITGLLSEILKYSYILLLPRLDFQEVYGPFWISVSMMIWAFLTGLLLLAGAHLSAQKIFLKEE